MKVLLINLPSPPGSNVERDFAGSYGVVGSRSRRSSFGHDKFALVLPPLLEAYAAGSLIQAGHEVAVLDAQIRGWGLDRISEFVEGGRFELLVARVSLPSLEHDMQALRKIRSCVPSIMQGLWGPVSSYYAEDLLRQGADFVITGELEASLPPLCNAIAEGEGTGDVSGLAYIREGKLVRTPPPEVTSDLDSLPHPAYELLDMTSYYDFGKIEMRRTGRGRRFFTVLSSRGCPFGCDYCPYVVEFGTRWRTHSPDRTVEEIETLVRRYSIEAIWFRDPTWNFDADRSIAICDGIVSKGLDVVWRAEMRADLVTPELASAMRQAGCVNAQVGLETGMDSLYAHRAKKGSDLARLRRGFEFLKACSIPVTANVMVGLPGDSWEGVRKTAEVLDELAPYRINVAFLIPYPGTRMFEEAKRNGWITTDDRWLIAGQSPVLSYREFGSDQIALARRYLLDRRRPKEKFKRLIRSLRDMDLQGAVAEASWIAAEPCVSKTIDEKPHKTG